MPTLTKPKTKTPKRHSVVLKNKGGRPPLPPKQRRNQFYSVRLTLDEVDRLSEPLCRKLVAEDVRELALEAAKIRTKNNGKK
jgi:hypothetical protein